ncbi:MAG: hypothetical protein DMD83_17930 [Candidatus Rokuibacteriota bacterium]|nr:MAG: hypothetical protein DMD83_17930 [Candidatus Rokubacteria bacterium]
MRTRIDASKAGAGGGILGTPTETASIRGLAGRAGEAVLVEAARNVVLKGRATSRTSGPAGSVDAKPVPHPRVSGL